MVGVPVLLKPTRPPTPWLPPLTVPGHGCGLQADIAKRGRGGGISEQSDITGRWQVDREIRDHMVLPVQASSELGEQITDRREAGL